MIDVELHLPIHYSGPNPQGLMVMRRNATLAQVPAPGDEVVISAGDAQETVARSIYYPDGRVIVSLRPVKTDSPEIMDELRQIAAEGGWTGLR